MGQIKLEHIQVAFPGTIALKDISFEIEQGKIVALCGENGAGKSTLGKVLAGVYSKKTYSGSLYFKGQPVDFKSTLDAEAAGICMVHQELNLIAEMTVAENISLGSFPNWAGLVKTADMRKRALDIFAELELDLNPDAKVSDLSISQQQMVEISKAISRNPEVIVFDEATSSLTDKEVEVLFDIMRRLKERGTTMIYVSHKLNEIFQICDEVVILKDGEYVNRSPVSEIDKDTLISWMVGRELKNMFAPKTMAIGEQGRPMMEVRDWCVYKTTSKVEKIVDHVNLTLHCGEILGIYGLMGAGRTEFVSSVFEGAAVPTTGDLRIAGETVHLHSSADAIAHGVALVTEDRRKTGLCLIHSIRDNATLAARRQFANRLMLRNEAAEKDAVQDMIGQLSIRLASMDNVVGSLSGGNQQKVVLSKWLLTKPQILILDEPTRGIDVGAKKEIYYILQKLADQGVAIIVISSELPEVMGVSDRIMVMSEGRVAGEMTRAEANEETLIRYAMKGAVS